MVRWIGPISEKKSEEVVVSETRESVFGRRTTLVLSLGSFVLSLFFLSGNITGNVVANFSSSGANWVGGIFFILAIAGFLLYIQKKKK